MTKPPIPDGDCEVVLAQSEDAAALAELAAATFSLACPPQTRPEDIESFIAATLSPAKFSDYLADAVRAILLARRGVEALGYAMLVYAGPTDPVVRTAVTATPSAELSKFYVRPHAQGGGVSDALMHAVAEHAAKRGAAGIWLGVNQENTRAQAFYRRSGFEVVGVRRFLVGTMPHDDFTMQRVL